ncbi:hypothetical protein I7I53_06513 [Histoplasma capsulatum var. duboisii H88]|uniref:Uncharacterized protein n=1 Tax=Ajellomyces capsulatus (strain H88) TaxID=544711 RepID=A0A8A1LHK1_AJEC8|nr:hypothetical protein I7I53_06513 [Histoplasma capsulatum var. duboisii H88]
MTFSWFNVPCLTSLELGNNLAKHRAVLHPGPRHHIAVACRSPVKLRHRSMHQSFQTRLNSTC